MRERSAQARQTSFLYCHIGGQKLSPAAGEERGHIREASSAGWGCGERALFASGEVALAASVRPEEVAGLQQTCTAWRAQRCLNQKRKRKSSRDHATGQHWEHQGPAEAYRGKERQSPS
ncbi:hypothetical protein NDU88_002322 [Pleurodeles waltl]|uniref:Uncharacterized protein n=1 Tax=Pleurodeles waltl TaxID=8319 RepID=A0AAV7UX93_PLEWA|nr:hypothetical protein NDU88_002322 [Pleurodeles waltl]